ncbi:hypothetical protein EDD93_3685 [Streptomyces sp. 840.1]|uniref:DUF6221 family protein n=1 Tax=Streptomyces sp. 840.1 TaxID=2485152 RepID=UPI000F465989|nr:DUF6221 family protein [Streptomyces sp. 840.1]ROQ69188.1 hypothetical protein EDD93_3685 [Streptomyces sp. 840.1]
MDDLTQFLRARLDEDDAAARAASWDEWDSAHWHAHHRAQYDGCWAIIDAADDGVITTVDPRASADPGVAAHIARHDPARALSEVEAKRQMVKLHACAAGHECSTLDRHGEIDHCTWVMDSEACTTLRLLALPYADHPDYRDDWRP